jgi:hypothetical protein
MRGKIATRYKSEIALLKTQAEEIEQAGGDLLAELAAAVREQIERAKKKYESLPKQERHKPA